MKSKKIFVLLLTLCCLLPCSGAFASNLSNTSDENIGLSPEIPEIPSDSDAGITPYEPVPPGWDILYPNNTACSVSGTASGSDLYTNKCFKNITSAKCSIQNKHSEHLTVSLEQVIISGAWTIKVDDYQVLAYGQAGKTFKNLSTGKYYCFRFKAPCKFSGNVYGYN